MKQLNWFNRWKAWGLVGLGMLMALALHLLTAAPTVGAADLIQSGRQQYQTGQYYPAAQSLEQAAQTYATHQDGLNQAIALTYLALSYQQLGQLGLAQTTIEQSLALIPSAGGSPVQQQVRAQALTAQGQILLQTGRPEQALESWQQAQTDYQQLDDRVGELGVQINQIQALRSIGFYRWAEKQKETLEAQLKQTGDPALQMLGWRSLGNLLRTVGQLEAAQTALESSWQIAQATGSDQDRAAILLGLGNTTTALADQQLNRQLLQPHSFCPTWEGVETALPYYAQAIAYYQQTAELAPDAAWATKARLNLLNLSLKLGQPIAPAMLEQIQTGLDNLSPGRSSIYTRINFAKSLFCYSRSQSVSPAQIQTAVDQVLAPALQQAQELQDERAYAYGLGSSGQMAELLGDLPAAQQQTIQALGIAQRIQAADIAYQLEWQLARLLQASQPQTALTYYQAAFTTLQDLRGDLTALNADLQFSFRDTVEPFHRDYADLLLRNPNQTNLEQARSVIEALQLAELDDFFRDACSDAQPELLDKIADQQDASAAILYPILLSDRLEIILKLPGQTELRHFVTPEREQTITRTLQNLRTQLEEPFTSETLKQPARQVYDWLIRPIQPLLAEQSIQTLVFVLDGALRNIPVAALYDGQNYLIENYAVAVTPGLQLLDPKPLQDTQSRLLAGGLVQPSPALAARFDALTHVPRELAEVDAIVPRSIQLLNEEFTAAEVSKTIQAQPLSIVHLATHGRFSSNLADTFILAYDTLVNVNELQALLQNRNVTDLNAIELLVLSACDTAKGDDRATLGMAGIAVRSGARSTLASLWKADDQATAELISEFYRQLFNDNPAPNKAIALQKAQRALLSQPEFQHPRHWAAFILLGNWL
jgi:CHAT domain-containing protein